jgi:hypothetical protein
VDEGYGARAAAVIPEIIREQDHEPIYAAARAD